MAQIIHLDGEAFVNVEQLMNEVCNKYADTGWSSMYKPLYNGYDETADDIAEMIGSLFGTDAADKFRYKWARARFSWAFKEES